MNKFLLFLIIFTGIFRDFANAQSPNISYNSPQTAFIGKPLTPITVTNTGGAVPNKLYPQNIFLNTTSPLLESPRDLVRTSTGDVFVCLETQIYRFRPDGTFSVFAGTGNYATVDGTGTSASFQEINGIDKDASDNLYITESNSADGANCKIRKITPAGVVTTVVSGLNGPHGIAVAPNGGFYITTYAGEIMKIAADGTSSLLAGQNTSGKANGVGANASFYTPNALVLDAGGNLYVNDSNNSLIRKVTPDGTVTTFAGSTAGAADGTGTAAKFYFPTDIAIDPQGNLIVADGFGLIRKITPAAVVTTIAQPPYYDSQGQGTGGSYYPNTITLDNNNNVVSFAFNGVFTVLTTGYAISPALPAGLTFGTDGSISGTPTALSAAQNYTVKAQNASGVSSTSINLGVIIPPDLPVITSFTPTSSYPGGLVTVTGNYFTGTTAVTIGGQPASSFTVLSPTSITAYVGTGAGSGSITVTNPNGTAALSGFTLIPPPTITSFSPVSGGNGTIITITGTRFAGVGQVLIGGYYASAYTVVSPTQIQATVGSINSGTGTISISQPSGSASLAGFTYINPPTISTITPASAGIGATIIINGSNLTTTNAVKFGSVTATSFTVVSASQITAVVPGGAGSGVSVTTGGGTVSYNGIFTVIGSPVISQVNPLTGGYGTNISIIGSNLSNAQVSIGGAPATVTFNSSNQLLATVGNGASSGNIQVTTPGGTTTFPGFIFVPAPAITSFTPQTAQVGGVVTITGTNLTGVDLVSFGNVQASAFTVISSTDIQATVGPGASGSVTVTSPGGTSSLPGFTHLGPTVTSFSPTSAGAGQTVVIQGVNFTGATEVDFGGVSATSFTVNTSTQITAVVGTGRSGSVTVKTPQGTGALAGFTHPGPAITSVNPLYAGPLSTSAITIAGTNFTGATAVSFGGVPAASFSVVSPASISATPAATTISGDVVVTTALGTDKLSGFIWVQPPTITSFTPASQKIGNIVTITGTNFTGVSSVKFGGVAALSFLAASSTSIAATVGSGASGSITVSTVGGTTSIPGFTYASPVIQSISPLTAAAGQTVTITGSNLDMVQTVQFGGVNAASFTIVSPATITAIVGTGLSGSVTVTGTAGANSFPGFTFIYQPVIYSVTPSQGGAGTVVSISGANLATTTSVQFGGTPAITTSITDNLIKATVGSGATGNISVTTIAGTVQYNGFTWFPAPTITSVSPATASAQTTVTITGTNFTGVTSVMFGSSYGTFTVVSPTQITAQPTNGTSGNIVVTSPGGSATFAGFTFIPAPTITSFTTSGVGQNSVVTISGSNFTNATGVQFGGIPAQSFTVNSSNTIIAVVGTGATGAITVVTPGGTATFSGFLFQPPPSITSFSPVSGPIGTTVTLTGSNFSTTASDNIVYFGPVKAKVTSATQTQLQVVVPAGANGLINVLNTDGGLAASSNLSFAVTNSSGFTGFANKFSIPFGLASPNFASDYKIHDFDGDGQPDLLVAKGDTLFILLHGPDPILTRSSYSKRVIVETGRSSVSLAVGDLDGDGKADILYSIGTSLVVLHNTSSNGNLSFDQTVLENINNIRDNMVLRDVDMDGLPDLVVASGTVYLNTTKGSVISFGPSTFLANTSSSSNISFALTDVDGDNKPDAILGSSYDGASIFQNNSVPGNASAQLFPLSYQPLGYYLASVITTADFDGDGKPDIAANNLSSSQYLVARNIAVKGTINTSAYAAPVLLPNNNLFFTGIFAGDIDGDGKPDIIGTTNFDVNYAKNTSTTGNISFNNPVPVVANLSSSSVSHSSVSDMDGDGRMDLIAIDGATNTLVIYNNGPAAVPQISSVTPIAAGAGATVTIVGKYLGAATAVSFGGQAAASFKVVSPDTVIAVVGAGASGTIALQGPDGPATFPGFQFVLPPVIASATPTTDGTGALIINGSYLSTTTVVSIAGTAATSITVLSDNSIKAFFGSGISGTLTVTTNGGSATLASVTVNAPLFPTVTAMSTNAAITGTSVTLTGTNFTGVTSVKFGGTDAASFTVNSTTGITAIIGNGSSGNVTVTTPLGTGTLAGFIYDLVLPPNNFKFSITSATCKGSNNGSVSITAVQALNYTATITGNGLNAPYPFTASQTIGNLATGTYNICITVAGQPNYQQCFTVVVTEPKDLSVYSTINPISNTVDLALYGGALYTINLNGTVYNTSAATISLPLIAGINNLTVTTDRLCQGVVEQTINNSGKIIPYPDPFQNTINLNLGLFNVANVAVEIYSMMDGSLVFKKQYINQSGVLQVDASNFKNGIYALKLILNGSVNTFKIMK